MIYAPVPVANMRGSRPRRVVKTVMRSGRTRVQEPSTRAARPGLRTEGLSLVWRDVSEAPVVRQGHQKLAGVCCWVRDMGFRMYVHSGIEETIRAEGFEPFYQVHTILWRIELYERKKVSA
jgi:hypothetical protein